MSRKSQAQSGDAGRMELDEAQVSDYLRAHPDFLVQHPELLETLELNHTSGSAVSLIERQVEILRGRSQRLEDRLTSEGGEAEEWLRLINAYVQHDRKDDALRIYRLAQAALKDDDSAGFVKEQALLLGVISE